MAELPAIAGSFCRGCGATKGRTHVVAEMMRRTGERFDYFECDRCGSLSRVGRPDDIARYYGDDYYSFRTADPPPQPTGLRGKLKRLRDAGELFGHPVGRRLAGRFPNPGLSDLRRWLAACPDAHYGMRILDVGCGDGLLVRRLRSLGFINAFGIDPFLSPDRASETLRPIALPDLPEGRFDLIMLHHALEHDDDPAGLLAAAADRLASRGRVLVRVPVVSASTWGRFGVDWAELDPPRHAWLPTIAALVRLGHASGLAVDRVDFEADPFGLRASRLAQRREPIGGDAVRSAFGGDPESEAQALEDARAGEPPRVAVTYALRGVSPQRRCFVVTPPDSVRPVDEEIDGNRLDQRLAGSEPFAEGRPDGSVAPRPMVSVIVPSYNHRDFLDERLESVFSQSALASTSVEFILLDDASTDGSAARLLEEADRDDVRVVISDRNSGSPFRQWLRGTLLARGRYVWIAESDDIAAPTLLARLLEQAETHGATLAYCRSARIDATGRRLGPLTNDAFDDQSRWESDYVADGGDEVAERLVMQNTIPSASGVLVRRRELLDVLRAMPDFRLAGDWWAWQRVLGDGGRVAYVADVLNLSRVHEQTQRVGTAAQATLEQEAVRVQAAILSDFDVMPEVRRQAVDRYVQSMLQGIAAGRYAIRPRRLIRFAESLRDISPALARRFAAGLPRAVGANIWRRWCRRPTRMPRG